VTVPGTFSLENQSEGTVAYMGGQAIGTIRFYGWAADNQGGLKDMLVDWGDGTVQEFHDARMKNKKPFCGVGKECQFVPGLTCNSDNDCPPAGGKCAATGFCKARPNISCLKDQDCAIGSTITSDKCMPRLTFGNTDLACEQNFFEFTHAYACGKEKAAGTLCQTKNSGLCSRDNTRHCDVNANTGCAAGDKCLALLAKPLGCFDVSKKACRFTPRVLLKDTWGWCTGECRTKELGGGKLDIGAIGSESVIYKNGGCYDGLGLYSNTNSSLKLLPADTANACDPVKTAGTNARPWIVFNGALQLGIAQ